MREDQNVMLDNSLGSTCLSHSRVMVLDGVDMTCKGVIYYLSLYYFSFLFIITYFLEKKKNKFIFILEVFILL